MGHSVGRWDGDVLIVDSIGFNDRAWMNSYPRTEKLHVSERYKRIDFAHLEVHVTIEDPGVFQKPWTINMTWELAPQEEILEFVLRKQQVSRERRPEVEICFSDCCCSAGGLVWSEQRYRRSQGLPNKTLQPSDRAQR
jgi:hypothetical protein